MNGPVSRDELEAIVWEFRHVQAEHRKAGDESAARRRFAERLHELERDLERLLAEWVPDEGTQRAWREHLHHGAPEPAEPAPRPPLAFRGRSDAGTIVEVRERNGGYEVEIDGRPAGGTVADRELAARALPLTFAFEDLRFRETFGVPPAALEALRAFVAGEARRPPWRYAAALAADGLVDRHFALTPRGDRALAAVRRR